MTDPACLVDSNVLVYAHEPSSPKHAAASGLVGRFIDSKSGVLSAQNLAEFCAVALEKRNNLLTREAADAAIDDFSKHFRMISYGSTTVRDALRIRQQSGVHFYDALLAATMLENGITTIYTENTKDFERIPGIKAVNPFYQR